MTNTKPPAKRKTKKAAESAATVNDSTATATAVESPRPAWIDGPATEEPAATTEPAKPWADPYKATFTCPAKQFELGENRRYKQIVFTFAEKPDPTVLQTLKDEGFQYRAREKAWTIPADAATRERATRLAQEWAAPGQSVQR
ncbi:MAG: hypothetical protein QM754_07970 [Tepidisphaeraceae bacterium]